MADDKETPMTTEPRDPQDVPENTAPLPPGMTKVILQEGEGEEMPSEGCEVTVHYTGTFEDGTEFDSSVSRGSPFNFTLGSGSVIKGWEIALKTMKRNEIAEFSLPPELAYGEKGLPPTIPENAKLNFTIELMDWVSTDSDTTPPVFKMSLEERLTKCHEKKTAGGVHFKEGKYDLAIKNYREIMKLAEIAEFKDDGKVVELESSESPQKPIETEKVIAQKQELKQMLLICYTNLALCYLKNNKLKECITNCDLALEIDPRNVKAHFRKGLAFLPTNDYEKALQQFDTVLEIDPNNAEAKVQKNTCTHALKSYYQKQKDIYKNLFAKK